MFGKEGLWVLSKRTLILKFEVDNEERSLSIR
jgi:hypothetical protein